MNQKEKRKQRRRHRLALTVLSSLTVFICLLITVLLSGLILYLLTQIGLIQRRPGRMVDALHILIGSLLLGPLYSVIVSRINLIPVNRVIDAVSRLAAGDFSTRLRFGRYLSLHPVFSDLCDNFNLMAQELQNTQLFRSDFINNFSHEFKTPIISIAGFASLLKRKDLTDAQRREYISVIEEESLRLSHLATNVLTLTKLESQSILTGVTRYSLSEQLRACLLLLESKWEKKLLELQPDFGEYEIEANEEMLEQVWLNLIDNAVKFAREQGQLRIDIQAEADDLLVSFFNTGEPISSASMDRLFQKFYQADASRVTQGNGIGLTIVKKAVALHGGEVWAESGCTGNTFYVRLPKKQSTSQ